MAHKKKPASSPDASRLSAIFADTGPLASRKNGYDYRPQQLGFARAVQKTFRERGVLLADAPTGTGKSAAYLAPAILDAASSSGGRVVVSTATLALQAQLLSEDLPPMRAAAAELMGYPEEEGITYAVLKGRSNFLCLRRHQDTLRAGTILDTDLISNLDLWAAETETGDREDLTFRLPVGPWMEIASDGEDCSPRLCTFREGCFYYAHRDRAGEADLVVVNHSLLLANAASGGAIFDTEDAHLVIDEAHRLEEVMAETFGARVSYGRVRYVMRQAKKRCASAVASADRAEMAAELFFEDLGSGTSVLHESPPRSYDTLEGALISVRSALASDPREEVNALQGMVGRLRRDLVSFYSKPDEDYAYAVVAGRSRRAGGRSYPELKSWLVETAEVFRENVLPLFESGGVVLTSATLATGSGPRRSFGYVRRRLGLDEGACRGRRRGAAKGAAGGRVEEFAGEEVFDYEGRCLVYVEEEIAPPTLGSPDLFARSCARRTEELVGLSGGQALVLLSTKRALAAFRESFRPPYPVRYQGDDSPGRLVRWLKETEGAILVGTRTFWEGVDIPGASVSLVVMDRVPFAPPDDPVAAKLREKAGERAFREVFLPKAQVAVRQGAGRLMRRATDRGVVALLDPRVSRKGWGKAVLGSLPPARRTGSLEEVARFFAEVPE